MTEVATPLTVLIAALGGEGGGVLTGWIVGAAEASGLPVQATSIPGVAQRTGATTYYVEIWPEPLAALGGRRPVLSLAPVPGEVDVLASTELLEAGRAIRNGYVTPDRTRLIASTHRFYTTAEKMGMADGRFDRAKLMAATEACARSRVLFDMEKCALEAGAPVSAVMLGAIAGAGGLPIEAEAWRGAIRADGRAVEANLRGFEAGMAAAQGGPVPAEEPAAAAAPTPKARLRAGFPAAAQETLSRAVTRLTDYQDAAYAALYLDRLAPFADGDAALLEIVARRLAVRMSFEDIIRVAQAKIRPERLRRIRGETGAADGEPVVVTEFFRPGLAEMCDVLPARFAGRLLARAERSPRLAAFSLPMEVNSTSPWGYARLRLLAGLRPLRRRSWRFVHEQRAIEDWLGMVRRAAGFDAALAAEIADCARLIKGYGDTHRRGSASYARIVEALVRPALAEGAYGRAEAVARARDAALADPDGVALADALAGSAPETARTAAE
ncbi:MAG: indolepyruvate oxidoreductase subunit beta family protein [Alphaproteobacteria bacterium]|nr:indolepyruvate oxidoreductase subunit beta family protein [Alphaproteobacteria bacterium]